MNFALKPRGQLSFPTGHFGNKGTVGLSFTCCSVSHGSPRPQKCLVGLQLAEMCQEKALRNRLKCKTKTDVEITKLMLVRFCFKCTYTTHQSPQIAKCVKIDFFFEAPCFASKLLFGVWTKGIAKTNI